MMQIPTISVILCLVSAACSSFLSVTAVYNSYRTEKATRYEIELLRQEIKALKPKSKMPPPKVGGGVPPKLPYKNYLDHHFDKGLLDFKKIDDDKEET